MNKKSQLNQLLEYKPIVNPKDNSFLFYPEVKEDALFMTKFLYSQIWTWQFAENNIDTLSSGYLRFNRNAYVITEKQVPVDRVFPNDITFQLLPRDLPYLFNNREVV